MVDRVSTSSIHEAITAHINQSMLQYNKAIEQLVSGKKFTNITDDPVAAVNVVNTNKQLEQISTFQTNAKMASLELDTMDDLLDLTNNYLSRGWDLALQANNQTYQGNSLKAIKTEIDELIKTVVDLANTEYDDKYIFSGANTKTLTYTIDEDGNITYNGTPKENPDYTRKIEVADGVFETVNTTGDRIFGQYYKGEVTRDADGNQVFQKKDGNYYYKNGKKYAGDVADLKVAEEEIAEGLLGTLKTFSNSLQMVIDGDTEEGYALMNSTLDDFKDAQNTILTLQTKSAGVNNRLDMTLSTMDTNSSNLTKYLSELSEVDYATAVTNWYNAQYAYQASMQIASSTMNMSLLNYLY